MTYLPRRSVALDETAAYPGWMRFAIGLGLLFLGACGSADAGFTPGLAVEAGGSAGVAGSGVTLARGGSAGLAGSSGSGSTTGGAGAAGAGSVGGSLVTGGSGSVAGGGASSAGSAGDGGAGSSAGAAAGGMSVGGGTGGEASAGSGGSVAGSVGAGGSACVSPVCDTSAACGVKDPCTGKYGCYCPGPDTYCTAIEHKCVDLTTACSNSPLGPGSATVVIVNDNNRTVYCQDAPNAFLSDCMQHADGVWFCRGIT